MTYSVLTGPAHGVLLINGAAANWFTQAEIDDHLVQYRASGDGATSDGFTFQATDAAGDQTPVTALNIVIADGAQGPDTTGQTPPRNDGMLTANLPLLVQYAAPGFPTPPAHAATTLA